jgi:hypothetical protein
VIEQARALGVRGQFCWSRLGWSINLERLTFELGVSGGAMSRFELMSCKGQVGV